MTSFCVRKGIYNAFDLLYNRVVEESGKIINMHKLHGLEPHGISGLRFQS